jgi:hypothetical protein
MLADMLIKFGMAGALNDDWGTNRRRNRLPVDELAISALVPGGVGFCFGSFFFFVCAACGDVVALELAIECSAADS